MELILGGCYCCSWFITWIVFVCYLLSGTGQVNNIKLPDLKSLQFDWSSALIHSVYEIDENKECSKNDAILFKMVWPGTKEVCYAEDVDFDFKRKHPSQSRSMKYFYESCRDAGYGNTKSCVKGRCTSYIDKRTYSEISNFKPKTTEVFYGKKYCGATLERE